MVLVEGLEIFRDRILVVEALRHHDRHGMGQRQSTHDKELEHVVERGRVAHVGLYDGRDVADVAQLLGVEHALAGLHPPAVATDGIDFAVMGEQTEGLGQRPRRKCVCAES